MAWFRFRTRKILGPAGLRFGRNRCRLQNRKHRAQGQDPFVDGSFNDGYPIGFAGRGDAVSRFE